MKIVHVISGLGTGGAEVTLRKLLSLTDRSRFEPEVVSLTTLGKIGPRIAELGVPVRAVGMCGSNAPVAMARLAWWLRRSAPDVVQTWLYHADLFGGIAARVATRAPVVWNLRHSEFDPGSSSRTLAWTVSACALLSHRLPAQIVTCSEASRLSHVARGYPPGRIVLIPNGFDLERFRPDPDTRAAVRRELGIPERAGLVGIIARHHPHKDFSTFLAAAARLAADRPDIYFLLCGPNVTWENAALAAEIDRLGLRERSRLLGRREDVERLDAALDVACSSSTSEGFPNVVAEAMACAVPCVATDVGDSALVVGDAGMIVPPRDPDALAQALRRVLTMKPAERRTLGLAARSRIEKRFDISLVISRYEELYARLHADGVARRAVAKAA